MRPVRRVTDSNYLDGWFRAADDRLERNEWTILKTVNSAGGPCYLLFRGKTERGSQTECVAHFTAARDAIDFVKNLAVNLTQP